MLRPPRIHVSCSVLLPTYPRRFRREKLYPLASELTIDDQLTPDRAALPI